ncbi:MAG: nucleotidyltransferase domain-containing protein [Candidatus Kapabacteria bacterium]|nr:nucleotidyltransferase domain-containing protein [Candidatus Kapabacteria bacterium]
MINYNEILLNFDDIIDFAILFGSFATGNFNNESDIDIGIYVDDKLYSEETITEIRDKFNELTDRELDLVVLNDADPIITMQILANGKLIYCKDLHQFNLYYARKISEYLDFKMSRKIIEDNLFKSTK